MARVSKHVRDWLDIVSVRIATRVADKAAVKRVRAGVAFIGVGLPDGAFNVESADHLMARTTGEPGPTEIREIIGAWWEHNKPDDGTSIPRDIVESGLAKPDQIWLAQFRRSDTRSDADILGTMRRFAPQAFTWAWDNEPTARRIAISRGWAPVTAAGLHADWLDPDVVARAVDTCMGFPSDAPPTWPEPEQIASGLALLRGIVTRWAPDNLHLIPDGPAPSERSGDRAETMRPVARFMDRGALDRAYAAQGVGPPAAAGSGKR